MAAKHNETVIATKTRTVAENLLVLILVNRVLNLVHQPQVNVSAIIIRRVVRFCKSLINIVFPKFLLLNCSPQILCHEIIDGRDGLLPEKRKLPVCLKDLKRFFFTNFRCWRVRLSQCRKPNLFPWNAKFSCKRNTDFFKLPFCQLSED